MMGDIDGILQRMVLKLWTVNGDFMGIRMDTDRTMGMKWGYRSPIGFLMDGNEWGYNEK